MILGFIGTGKISSSIIFGIFKSKLKIKRIYISSRNRNIAKKLSKSYGKIKVPAALLTGTLVASGLLQITEIASYQISPDIIDYCLLILGSSVGCRFADKTFGEIGRNALHGFVATFLLVVLGVGAAVVASMVIDKNFFTLLLSYCPGGIYEVAVIAIFFDLDPEFVSFHHIIRLLMILFAVPIMLKIISKKA